MSARRLLLLTTELVPAGAERVVYELATRISAERWQVTVASLRSPGGDDGQVARDLLRAGVSVESLRFAGKGDVLGVARFGRLVSRLRPHVLHAHLFHANLAARLLGKVAGARRVVSTIHVVERRPLAARGVVERLTAGRDDATVCVSEAVARHATSRLGVSPGAVRVIPNGIDLARYAKRPDPEEARRALGLPLSAKVVGAVGRLSAQKGLPVLIEAFAGLEPDAVLALAGAGEDEAALRALASKRGLGDRVRFLGFQEDVPRVLAALDVFCMPSLWEGFGLSLVEALAAGKPCVASDVDSLPEVMGDAGLLVAPADPTALREALEHLLTDREAAADLGSRGPDQAAAFEVGRMVSAYEALYDELLS